MYLNDTVCEDLQATYYYLTLDVPFQVPNAELILLKTMEYSVHYLNEPVPIDALIFIRKQDAREFAHTRLRSMPLHVHSVTFSA